MSRDVTPMMTASGVATSANGGCVRLHFTDGSTKDIRPPRRDDLRPRLSPAASAQRARPLMAAVRLVLDDPGAWGIDLTGYPANIAEDVQLAAMWAVGRWTAQQAAEWRAARVLFPADAHEALRKGFTAAELARWRDHGVDSLNRAVQWRSLGVAPEDAREPWLCEAAFAKATGTGIDDGWATLHEVMTVGFVAEARTQDRSPAEAARLAKAIDPHVVTADRGRLLRSYHVGAVAMSAHWTPQEEQTALDTARQAARHSWADVAACVETGMDLPVALAHVTAGEDMEAIRLVAALAA